MTKVVGSYQSIIKGVSEQVPQDRRPGQHYEQINMLSDPVLGLSRRHGSMLQDEDFLGVTYTQASLDDAQHFKTFTFFNNGTEYALLYRTKAKVMGSQAPLCWCFNKETGKFISVVRLSTDTVLDQITEGGVSTLVAVGKYLCIAGNTVTPVATELDRHAATSGKAVVWIRGGAYSRRFKITCTRAVGAAVSVEYTTVSSSYPGTLDTSDILYSDPDYTKKVGDRTNAYNVAVTQWLGTASAQTQPAYIAARLQEGLAAAGISSASSGSSVVMEGVTAVETDDGADGTLIRAVADEVVAPEAISPFHWPGKVVKVRPKGSTNNGMYLEAVPKRNITTDWTEVTWRETAGVQYTPADVFALATIDNDTMYIGGNAQNLLAVLPGTHPWFEKNLVGDSVTSPLPAFFGKEITYLGVFQDRLMIVAGPIISMSKPGDYFNFFRTSVLTVEDNDPIEIFSLGAEDDVIRGATTYAQSTILFGDRKQYRLSARQVMTPKTASVVVMTSYEHAIKAFPVDSGNYAFYAKDRGNYSSLFQFQIGQLVDTPDSYEISKQLNKYLAGEPQELVAVTSPNTVFVRSTGIKNGVSVYNYLDSSGGTERVFDSWSKWLWDASLGEIVGMAGHRGDLVCFTLRTGETGTWIAADKFVLTASLSEYPYMDSLRPLSTYTGNATWLRPANPAKASGYMALSSASAYAFLGGSLADYTTVLSEMPTGSSTYAWVGIAQEAYVKPTNPYLIDSKEKAITSGRLVITKLGVSVANTGGMDAYVDYSGGTLHATNFTGRILGTSSSTLGHQPIVSTKLSVPVGRANTEYAYTLKARTWLPLTITAIDWAGQSFSNSRRV